MNLRLLNLLPILVFTCQNLSSQINFTEKFKEDHLAIEQWKVEEFQDWFDAFGVCFMECKMPAVFGTVEKKYFVYSGNLSKKKANYKINTITIRHARSKWTVVASKPDKPNRSNDSTYVWRLRKFPEEIRTLKVLKDTIGITEFEEIWVNEEYIEQEEKREWYPVVCPDLIDAYLVAQLQKVLSKMGYNTGADSENLNDRIRGALINFQYDHKLPTGKLDFKTMEYLGLY